MAPEHAAAEVSSHVMRGGSDADDEPPPSDIRSCTLALSLLIRTRNVREESRLKSEHTAVLYHHQQTHSVDVRLK